MSVRSKRRSENKSPSRLAISGTIVLVGVIGLLAFGVYSVTGVPGVNYGYYWLNMPDIGNLRPHDEIRVAGVRVGQVLDQEIEDGRARVQLQMQPGYGSIPEDSTVVVRARGLLGSRFLELVPGDSSEMLDEGGEIRAQPVTSLTNGVADVLDTFDEETRGRFGNLLTGLGNGVFGRGAQFNNVIREAPTTVSQLTRVADAIEARSPAARNFVPSLDAGMGAFDAARDDLANMFAPGAAGLAPFTEARGATQATLDEAPSTLSSMETGLGTGRQLLASTRSLAHAANRALPQAPAALRDTTKLLRESPRPLRRTASLLRATRPTVPDVLRITRSLSPNLVPLRRAFDDADPVVGELAKHNCDIENFADNWRSVLGPSVESRRDIPMGNAGPLHVLRVTALFKPGIVQNLVPSMSRGFVRDREVYMPPCKYSPGRRYNDFGVQTDTGTGNVERP